MSLERGVVELTRGLYTFMIHLSNMSFKWALVKLMPALLELFHSPVINWWYLPRYSLGFWIPSRGLRTPGTGFHIFFSGTWIPDSCSSVFRIPKSRILDSTSNNFPNSKIRIALHTWGNDVKRRLHRCHVCTINPLDKRSNVCVVKILWSKLDKSNIGVLTSVLTIVLWSVTIPDVRAIVIIAVRYAITETLVNIHKILRRRAKKDFGALSPYLRKENND